MVRVSKQLAALSIFSCYALAQSNAQASNGTEEFSQNLLHESMDWMDMYYDNERGYLFSLEAAALTHETRASVWYAAGLLARNELDDAEQANRIIRNVIGAQFKNGSEQW